MTDRGIIIVYLLYIFLPFLIASGMLTVIGIKKYKQYKRTLPPGQIKRKWWKRLKWK